MPTWLKVLKYFINVSKTFCSILSFLHIKASTVPVSFNMSPSSPIMAQNRHWVRQLVSNTTMFFLLTEIKVLFAFLTLILLPDFFRGMQSGKYHWKLPQNYNWRMLLFVIRTAIIFHSFYRSELNNTNTYFKQKYYFNLNVYWIFKF